MTTIVKAILTDQGAEKIQTETAIGRALLLSTIYVGTLKAGIAVEHATYSDFEKLSSAVTSRHTSEGETYVSSDMWDKLKDTTGFTYDTVAISDSEGTLMYIGKLDTPIIVAAPEDAEPGLDLGILHTNVKVSLYHRSSVNQETLEDFMRNRPVGSPLSYTTWDGTEEALAKIKTGSLIKALADAPLYEAKAQGVYFVSEAPEGQTKRALIELETKDNSVKTLLWDGLTPISELEVGTLVIPQVAVGEEIKAHSLYLVTENEGLKELQLIGALPSAGGTVVKNLSNVSANIDEYGVISEYRDIAKGDVIYSDRNIQGITSAMWKQTFLEKGLYLVEYVDVEEGALKPSFKVIYEPSLPAIRNLSDIKVGSGAGNVVQGFYPDVKAGDLIRSEADEEFTHALNPNFTYTWKKGGLYLVNSTSKAANGTLYINVVPLVEPEAQAVTEESNTTLYDFIDLIDESNPDAPVWNATYSTLKQGDLVRQGTGTETVNGEIYPAGSLYLVGYVSEGVLGLQPLVQKPKIHGDVNDPNLFTYIEQGEPSSFRWTADTLGYSVVNPVETPLRDNEVALLRLKYSDKLPVTLVFSKSTAQPKDFFGGSRTYFVQITDEDLPIAHDRDNGTLKNSLGVDLVILNKAGDVATPDLLSEDDVLIRQEVNSLAAYSLTSAWAEGDMIYVTGASYVVQGTTITPNVYYQLKDGQLIPLSDIKNPSYLVSQVREAFAPSPYSSDNLNPSEILPTNAITTHAEKYGENVSAFNYEMDSKASLVYLVLSASKQPSIHAYEQAAQADKYSTEILKLVKGPEGNLFYYQYDADNDHYLQRASTNPSDPTQTFKFMYGHSSYANGLVLNDIPLSRVYINSALFTVHVFTVASEVCASGLETLSSFHLVEGTFQENALYECVNTPTVISTPMGIQVYRKGDTFENSYWGAGVTGGPTSIKNAPKPSYSENLIWRSSKHSLLDFTSGIRKGICVGYLRDGNFGPFNGSGYVNLSAENAYNLTCSFIAEHGMVSET